MPRLDPQTVKDEDLYNVVQIDNNLTMRERMAKRFRAHDTVQVWNLDDEAIQWQWLAEDDETFVMDEDIKIMIREKPGLWRIEAGEKDVLEGGNAYMMIEALFKQMAVKKVGPLKDHPLDEREIKNFSLDDGEAQEKFIDRVFLGRLSPAAMQAAVVKQMEQPVSAIPKPKAEEITEPDTDIPADEDKSPKAKAPKPKVAAGTDFPSAE